MKTIISTLVLCDCEDCETAEMLEFGLDGRSLIFSEVRLWEYMMRYENIHHEHNITISITRMKTGEDDWEIGPGYLEQPNG